MALKKDYYKNMKAKCITVEETGCWIFQGKARHVQGYGFARHNGVMKTIQRGMAEELELFPNIDSKSRIGNSCSNKLCVNPDHLIHMTHTEVMFRRYQMYGSGGQFNLETAKELRDEFNHMKANKIPRTIHILAEKYKCSTSVLYRTIDRANGKRVLSCDIKN
tara:strand:- start:1576 stop:2064 length:489 start_codon:yes stop_codon:yes gene_type:complete